MRYLLLRHRRWSALGGSALMTGLLCLALGSATPAQTTGSLTPKLDGKMTEARGSFEVKIAPRSPAPDGYGAMSLDKTYTGELQAIGKGEMLSAGDPRAGNAGYVAIERITGSVAGRSGSFALMQSGIMATGVEPKLIATIVPGSGTGELSGIYGSMTLVAAGGHHSYTIDYAFSK